MSFVGLGNTEGKMKKVDRVKMITRWLDDMPEKEIVAVQYFILGDLWKIKPKATE